MIDCIKVIRARTRLFLPEDDCYIYRLGVALYGFASTASFLNEIIRHIDSNVDAISLADLSAGKLLDKFRQIVRSKRKDYNAEEYKIMTETADLFEQLNTDRNALIHAVPITNSKEQQALYRWNPNKKQFFEIDDNYLDNFIARFETISDNLYQIRNRAKTLTS